MLGEWAGLLQWLPRTWFWFGNQGWEYLEIGRFWQMLLAVGLLFWFFLVWRAVAPARRDPGTARLRQLLSDRGLRHPAVLSAGAVLRLANQLHHRRCLAVLDHPSVGGRLLRILRHRHRGRHLLRDGSGPAAHGAAHHLSRRHPLFRRRAHRHRPSLVLDRADRAQHGDLRRILRARGRTADPDHARCLGLREGDPRAAKRSSIAIAGRSIS